MPDTKLRKTGVGINDAGSLSHAAGDTRLIRPDFLRRTAQFALKPQPSLNENENNQKNVLRRENN